MIPLIVSILVCVAGAAVFALLYFRIKAPEHRARLRSVGPLLAYAVGAGLFIGGWLATSRRIAELLGGSDSGNAATIQGYFDGTLYMLIATGALILLLRLERKLASVIDGHVTHWAQARNNVRFRGLLLMSRTKVRDSVLLVTRFFKFVVAILLLYIYVPLVMSFFPLTAPYGDRLLDFVTQPAIDIVMAVVGYIPKLVYLVVIVVVARYSLKVLHFFLTAVGRGDLDFGGFDPEWAEPTYKLVRALAVVFTLMVGFPYLPGAESEFFQGFSLFVGALFTLGSTAAIGNMVAGVILTYTRTFRVGDRVRIGDAFGDVQVKSLFVTRLRNSLNEEITVPNGAVLAAEVINYSTAAMRGELALKAQVTLGYDYHWTKIDELLKQAANQTPGIRSDPPPRVWPRDFAEFGVLYELHAYTDRANKMGSTYAALRRSILDVLHQEGIQILTPVVESPPDKIRPPLPPPQAAPADPAEAGIRIDAEDQSSQSHYD